MHVIFFAAAALIGFVIHTALDRGPRKRDRVLELFLLWFFAVVVGCSGIFGFTGHTLVADDVARQIGWPAGNPFQTEVAFTNLAFGVLGLLCIRFRGDFWLATAVGWGIFLVGAGITHAIDLTAHGNDAPNNTGPVLWGDFLKPVILLAALCVHRRWRRAGPA
jgi:hypothetical protein